MRLISGKHCASSVLRASVSSEGGSGDFPALFIGQRSNGAHQFVAVLAWHSEIAHKHVWLPCLEHIHCLIERSGGTDRGIALFKHSPYKLSRIGFIVDG